MIEMSATEDEDAIETVGADGPHPAFGFSAQRR
jgi:hypothetical protein